MEEEKKVPELKGQRLNGITPFNFSSVRTCYFPAATVGYEALTSFCYEMQKIGAQIHSFLPAQLQLQGSPLMNNGRPVVVPAVQIICCCPEPDSAKVLAAIKKMSGML